MSGNEPRVEFVGNTRIGERGSSQSPSSTAMTLALTQDLRLQSCELVRP